VVSAIQRPGEAIRVMHEGPSEHQVRKTSQVVVGTLAEPTLAARILLLVRVTEVALIGPWDLLVGLPAR
jgi:hypothetical protein